MKTSSDSIKSKIIKSSIDCFYESGFEETTFKQIASKVGVTQPLIYNYFSNKMDLLLACAQVSAEGGRRYIDSHVDQKQPAFKRLNQYIQANLDWFSKERASGFSILAIYYFAATHEEIRKFFDVVTHSAIERIEILLHQIQNEEKIKLRNPNFTARMIHDILVGELFKSFLSHSRTKINSTELFATIRKLITAK